MDAAQRVRLDNHAVQAHIILAKSSTEGEIEQNNRYVLGYTGAVLPTHNFFIPLTLAGLTDETLADASAFFRSRNTMYAVSLEEHRVPDGTEYLSKRRYQPLPPQPVMACTHLPAEAIQQNNLRIKHVETVPGMTALYSVLEAVFDYSTDEVMLLFPASQIGQEEIRHYVGYTPEGRPVTIGTAICADKAVSVWNLSTLDNFRRRGYATLLLNKILSDAAQKGCDLSLIYTTPMGFSLANNLGFKLHALRQWFLPQEIG